MKKALLFLVCVSGLLLVSNAAYAIDLAGAYQDALRNDPTFKEAQAVYERAQEATAISHAILLPQLNLGYRADRTDRDISGEHHPVFNNQTYTVNASQTLFNWGAFQRVSGANASVRQAAAVFAAASQDLMMRLATAYFAAANAEEELNNVKRESIALLAQHRGIKKRYKVRHATITEVDEAKASYDLSNSRVVGARIALNDRRQELAQVTGKRYKHFKMLKRSIPLLTPTPNNMVAWVQKTYKQNFLLRAARYGAEVAHYVLHASVGAFLPTVNAVGEYAQSTLPKTTVSEERNSKTLSYGVDVRYALSQGGLSVAEYKQAQADYSRADAARQVVRNSVVSEAQKAYVSTLEGIAQIKVDQRALTSTRDALRHSNEEYQNGTKTLLDVLEAQRNVLIADNNYSRNRYVYLLSTLRLKQAAGILSPNDLVAINRWIQYYPNGKMKK